MGKNCNLLGVGGFAPRIPVGIRRLDTPPPNPRVVTPACYYNFVQFVSNA